MKIYIRHISLPLANNHFIAYFKGPFNFTLNGHGYFYSGWVEEHKSDKVDWLEARNTCREYCMDLASLETPTEDEMIRDFLIKGIIFPQVSFATLANITVLSLSQL